MARRSTAICWLRSHSRHLLLAAGALAACRGDDVSGPAAGSAVGDGNTYILVGAGNIGRCGSSYDEATGRLLDQVAGTVFTAGDNLYTGGSLTDFNNCFHPSWGRHKSRIRPAAGDAEYAASGASGYFDYFGAAAGPRGKGYYSYDLGDWHVVILNTGIAMYAGSPQEQWLRADLAASTRRCTVAIWHYPRFSSYSTHVRSAIKPLWDALYQAGVELVVNGHYRFYERYAPQTPDGKPDPTGIRQFIVGTGGTGVNPFDTVMPNSEVRKSGVYGVLKLALSTDAYTWQFVPISTQSFRDSGSGTCHGPRSGSGGSNSGGGATVSSVTLTPASISLAVGDSAQLTATPRDAQGDTVSGASVAFSSTNTTVMKVAANGVVTGVAIGVAHVIATSGGKADTSTVTVTSAPTTSVHKGYYAAPTGLATNDGSYSRPWNLATALAGGGGRVQPGDTIWLRGGVYRGAFRTTVSGRAGAPVVIRGFPGEQATIDGSASTKNTWYVGGQWTVFWDFEIMNSNPTRYFATSAGDQRQHIIVNYASHTRYVNLVLRDGGVAFYTEPEYVDIEVTGCIIYNNGWQGTDRGHGHALYVKSYTGPVLLRDNVIFNQFGYGVHIYTNAGSGELNNIRLDGNVSFNNGSVATSGTSPNILVGGEDTADDDVLVDNFTWFSPGLSGTNVRVGYGSVKNGDVRMQGNYFVGGSQVVDFGYWATAQVSSNTFVGASAMIRLNDGQTSGKSWSGNGHYRDPYATAWRHSGTSYTFPLWQSKTGLASNDQATNGQPLVSRVFVRQNPYDPGRAMVVVYNWSRVGAVSADLSGILRVGDQYVVRSVQNLYGTPAVKGIYGGGAITIPVAAVAPPYPIGWTRRGPTTGPDFDVFIVTRN